MTLTQQIITIGMVVLGTAVTRFLPFLVFPAGKPTPKYVQYLGKVLPAAVFGLLVTYSLKEENNYQIDMEELERFRQKFPVLDDADAFELM